MPTVASVSAAIVMACFSGVIWLDGWVKRLRSDGTTLIVLVGRLHDEWNVRLGKYVDKYNPPLLVVAVRVCSAKTK